MQKSKILFYSSVSDLKLFYTQKFYFTDIKILEELGYEVIISNKIHDALYFWKYNFVLAYFYRKSFFVALIAYILRRRTYFTGGIDDLDREYATTQRYYIQKIFIQLCYWISKSCIIVSPSDMNNVLKVIKKDRKNKLILSEHCIDTDLYILKKMPPKENLFTTIVWMGDKNNVKRKGIDIALRIFSRLIKTKTFSHYKFIIIGKKGVGTDYVNSIIHKYGIQDLVILTDEISEEQKIAYLSKSKYYFQLSKYEGFGVAALEALALHNIVIHSGKGGLSNPIFNYGIKFNIDTDFKKQYSLFLNELTSKPHDMTDIDQKILTHYSVQRRFNDFAQILHLN